MIGAGAATPESLAGGAADVSGASAAGAAVGASAAGTAAIGPLVGVIAPICEFTGAALPPQAASSGNISASSTSSVEGRGVGCDRDAMVTSW
jgi:hypothetical protein